MPRTPAVSGNGSQQDLFGEPPDGDPTELTVSRKSDFGRVTVKFSIEPGLNVGAAAIGIENQTDNLIRGLESLHSDLKDQELLARSRQKARDEAAAGNIADEELAEVAVQ